MPEGQDPRLLARHVAGSEHGVRMAFEKGFQKLRIFVRVVLEVSVLHEAEVASSLLNRGSNGRAFALILFMPEQTNAGMLLRKALQNIPGSVRGTVIDDDQFPVHVFRKRRLEHDPQ